MPLDNGDFGLACSDEPFVYCARAAGNSRPSPIFATPGMVTGERPRIGDSPNSAFTAAVSDGGTVLKVSRKADALGKLRTR